MTGYALKTPKVVDGQTVVEIPCRELELDEVIELKDLDTDNIGTLKAFLARVTGAPEAVIGRLSMSDFQGLFEAISGPLAAPRGGMPSASAAKSPTSTPQTSSASAE